MRRWGAPAESCTRGAQGSLRERSPFTHVRAVSMDTAANEPKSARFVLAKPVNNSVFEI